MDTPARAIEKILTEADALMRRRLERRQLGETDHLILAIAPDGATVIRSNCGPAALRAMASMLVEIAGQVEASGGIKAH